MEKDLRQMFYFVYADFSFANVLFNKILLTADTMGATSGERG